MLRNEVAEDWCQAFLLQSRHSLGPREAVVLAKLAKTKAEVDEVIACRNTVRR